MRFYYDGFNIKRVSGMATIHLGTVTISTSAASVTYKTASMKESSQDEKK